MARIRSIKPEFWKSESIAALPLRARLTFIGLWTYVDDNGVGLDNERLIVAEIFPLEVHLPATLPNLSEDLATLSRECRVTRYMVDGKHYIAVTGWAEHQKIDKPNKPRYPGPNKAQYVEVDGEFQATEQTEATLAGLSRDLLGSPSPGTEEQGTEEQRNRDQGAGDVPSPAVAGSTPSRVEHAQIDFSMSDAGDFPRSTIPTPVITIPTITGPEFPVTQEVINDFQEAYPAVDVMAKLRALRMWSMTNPKRRKTYGGMMRWLNGRLAEVQDSGGGRVQARGTGAPNRQVQLEQSNRAAADAWLEQEEAGHG